MTKPAAPRWLDYLPVEELEGADRNPKGHDLDALGASMDRFGYTEPIVLDERTGKLVSGHGRMTQLLIAENDPEKGDPPEGIQVGEDGRWLVPVVRGWSSANDLEAEMFLVAANQLTIAGGWADQSGLLDLLTAGREGPLGLLGTGFGEQEVEDLLSLLSPPPTLDELEKEHGEPDPADFWPVLRFRVPPDLRARFVKLTAEVTGGDHDAFAFLVERAEAAPER